MAPVMKKRRLNVPQPAELTFDPNARQEYLTGFHKRKVARKENAQETAIKRDKEERVVQRKQMRDQRKKDLELHIAEFNAELRKQNMDFSEVEKDAVDSEVIEGVVPEEVGQEDEYVDEDKYTTVTVEAMGDPKDDESEPAKIPPKVDAPPKKPRPWEKDGKPKAKKHKFRYESKAERQNTRRKQKDKNQAQKAKREKG